MDWSKPLPRDYVVKSVLGLIEDYRKERRWGKIEVAFQNGEPTTIRDEKTQLIERSKRLES
jgi:sulfatase maturation enzyme AslB (radical SAM superfamily)